MAKNQPDRKNRFAPPSTAPSPSESIRCGVELKMAANSSIFIHTGNSQDRGARPYQEDSFGFTNIIDSKLVSEKGMFAVLSDGMGGLNDGKSVADFVVQSTISMFDSMDPRFNIGDQLQTIARSINEFIVSKYSADGVSKAGATMVCAYIFKNRIYWLTVGDSRLYCCRRGHLIPMNEDHDYKNRLLRDFLQLGENGDISVLQDIESNPQKDSLVSFIGKAELTNVDVSLTGYRIKPNDVFVLCSDGIYNALTEDMLIRLLQSDDAQNTADRIVSTISNAHLPGQDNMTVLVIECKKDA